MPVRFSMALGTPDSDGLGRQLVFDNWPQGMSRLVAPPLLALRADRTVLGVLSSHASGEETLAFLRKLMADHPDLAPAEDPTLTMVYDATDPAERELAELERQWDAGERESSIDRLHVWLSRYADGWAHGAATVKTLLGAAYYRVGDLERATHYWEEVVEQHPDHPARYRAFHNLHAPSSFPWLSSPDTEGALPLHPTRTPVFIPDADRRTRNIEAIANDPRYVVTRSGLPLVRVEAGTFTMGGQPAEFGRELPLRTITLTRPFLMAAWPITYRLWRTFRAEGNPSPSDPQADDLPWNRATMADTAEFCAYLSEVDGLEYRLPTEAQWEYAARGGIEGAPYPWGSEPPGPDRCNYDRPHPVPVGCYAPNAFGLFDMVGNCLERVADPYVENQYATTPDHVVDPVASPVNAAEQKYNRDQARSLHAARGGTTGFDFFKHTCRNSFRVGTPDTFVLGFRLIAFAE